MPEKMILGKKLGIIIGAGASASINPNRIPVMNNFFEIVADFAQRDEQVAKTLKTLQKYGPVSRQKIPKGNLEDVLTQTLSLPREPEDPWERPYDGLLLTLHRVFHVLDKEENTSLYTDCLSPLCKLNPEDIIFISFNYDVSWREPWKSCFHGELTLGIQLMFWLVI